LDIRLNEMENKIQNRIDELNEKYNVLKEQMAKMMRYQGDYRNEKGSNKHKYNEEIRNLENKITVMLQDERKVNLIYI
jgi:hypothetical protein